ncbi:MFS transporter [Svornostia abyssi]|uniref:MFS transporter n=1 Tax=Svornostia abyssi TaxID=2898438 RepID=A0ABY5PKW9_9ACTN|nr:MFS transporter [Parviterribacteraceae bacterium J379]
MRRALPALAAGLVLADSSVVTLALPEILRALDATVAGVAWVLISFNLALAVAAVPLARLAPRPAYVGGLVVFAAACLVCASAESLGVLIAGRVAQGVAGAAVVAAALALARVGEDPAAPSPGLRAWALAGVLGAALGPAAGGILTEAFSWEAMFALQAPVALVAILGVFVARRPATAPDVPRPQVDKRQSERARDVPAAERPPEYGGRLLIPPAPIPAQPAPAAAMAPTAALPAADLRDDGRGRPRIAPLLALALLSAALTAALFLLVVMLIEGWRYGPAGAALAVSVMPIAAILARPLESRLPIAAAAGAGTVAVGGGLIALGLLPDASWWWLVLPQVLIGFGLGAALPALTAVAIPHAVAIAGPASWTIAARHAGVVVGLLLLTPVFTADLDAQQDRTERAGLAALLDAPLGLETKIDLAQRLADRVASADGRLPDLAPAYAGVDGDPAQIAALADELDDQLDRAGTAAFSRSLQLAGLLALLALVPLLVSAGVRRRAALAGAAVAAALSSALVVGYVAAGGGTYEPTAERNPCGARERPDSDERFDDVQRILLSVLDGGACELDITREELLLNLIDEDTRRSLDDDELTEALKAGVRRAQEDGTLGFLEATALEAALSTGLTDDVIRRLLDQ